MKKILTRLPQKLAFGEADVQSEHHRTVSVFNIRADSRSAATSKPPAKSWFLRKSAIISMVFLLGMPHNVIAAELLKPADNATVKIIAAITSALEERGVEGKLKVSLNNPDNGFNARDGLESYKINIAAMNINRRSGNFKADLAITSPDNQTSHYNITGSYEPLVRIPALAQKMPRDAVIEEADIAWLEIPGGQVKFDTVTDANTMIGQSLKRNMAGGTPLKKRDLQKLQLIARNSAVNILFDTPTISLKATGVALDNGGLGDVIRVRNSSSNKIIQAIVHDEQNVAAMSQNNQLINSRTARKDLSNEDFEG